MTTTKHPAPFSPVILEHIETILMLEAFENEKRLKVLDPFAGIGKIHSLCSGDLLNTYGIELEPEWANMHRRTRVGNALHLPFGYWFFDAIATSPCYGNRMADHHNARDGSERRTYKHYLGRDLSEDSSAVMFWGPEYRKFHRKAWREADRVLRPGGLFVLNIANHEKTLVKGGDPVEQHVSEFHIAFFLTKLNYTLVEAKRLQTKKYKYGANRHRSPGELVVVMRKAA